QVFGRNPWGAALLPGLWVAVAVAAAAAVIGMAAGRALALEKPGIPVPALALAGVALAALLVVPLPRTAAPVKATLQLTPAPSAQPHTVNLRVAVSPADAARGADWFTVISWQGGGFHQSRLIDDGGGRF